MSYTNETTHYGIPLPLGTDLTTPMDYNQSMQALDTAVFGAVTDATAGVQKANAVEEALGTTNDNVSALTGRVTTAEGTIVTQGNAITQLQLDVADTKADALDMICAVDEGTAQVATVAVQTGKYFRYNDVLYMATANIAIGDTIVPNTNCRATNVATELEGIDIVDLTPRVTALEGQNSNKYGITGVSYLSGTFANKVQQIGDNRYFIAFTANTSAIMASGDHIFASIDSSLPTGLLVVFDAVTGRANQGYVDSDRQLHVKLMNTDGIPANTQLTVIGVLYA